MQKQPLIVILASAAAVGAVFTAAFSLPLHPVGAEAAKPDRAQVKGLYSEKCSACHNLPQPEEKGFTRAEWQRTVNKMLTKYKASDSISPTEAAQIVDYLATFAPKEASRTRKGRGPADPWATDTLDVWTNAPVQTRVFNFEGGGLPGLSPVGSGTSGAAPLWKVIAEGKGANGAVLRASGPNFRPDRFGLLIDSADAGKNLDVRVRFRIDTGKVSPAVGIVFGYRDSKTYSVLRCNQALGDLALIQIAEPAHTTVQQTVIAPDAAAPLAPGWHTLRLLVHDGEVRGWIDMQKRISTALPDYTGGKVGLWTQGDTTASFDDWTVDWYDAPKNAPVS